jgi:hypothetical protein
MSRLSAGEGGPWFDDLEPEGRVAIGFQRFAILGRMEIADSGESPPSNVRITALVIPRLLLGKNQLESSSADPQKSIADIAKDTEQGLLLKCLQEAGMRETSSACSA